MSKSKRVALAAAVAAGSVALAQQAHAVIPYFQSFNTSVGDWDGNDTVVADGTGGSCNYWVGHSENYTNQTPSPNGPPDAPGGVFTDAHNRMQAVIAPGTYQPPTGDGGFGTGGVSRLGGDGTNDATYKGDYFTAVDVYVDLAVWLPARPGIPLWWLDTAGRLTDGSLAAPGTEASMQFNRDSIAPDIRISNPSANGTTPGNYAPDIHITETGWYTFVVTYSKGTIDRSTLAGIQAKVEMDYYVLDSAGLQVGATQHKVGIPAASRLGSGGYQWITVWQNDAFDCLALDNSRSDLGRLVGIPEPASLGLLSLGGLMALRRRKALMA